MSNNINIGDRVRCIDAAPFKERGAPTGLVKGRDYIVYDKMKQCCYDVVDIGLPYVSLPNTIVCGTCKKKVVDDKEWRGINRFIKVEEGSTEKKEEAVSAIKLTRQLVLSEN